jgi:hypothetical protein
MSMSQEASGTFVSSVKETAAVKATGTNEADGVFASSDGGFGVNAFSNSGIGVRGVTESDAEDGIGVQGISTFGIGVHGHCASGAGVYGETNGGNGVKGVGLLTGIGVNGFSKLGIGVSGKSDTDIGVSGTSNSIGVRGTSDGSIGVEGVTSSGIGVQGTASSSGIGINGFSNSGIAISGGSDSGTGIFGNSISGLAGRFDGDVQVSGNFSVTGTKAFVQTHPTDPDREIVYVALEGGEAGTYVRGSGQLESGKAVLSLPEHFGLVTSSEDLTVQLTPRGQWLQLYVVELDTTQLVVREAQSKSGTFDYLIQGVRRGYQQHEVVRAKR